MRKIVVVDDEIRQCRGLKNILMRLYENLEVEAFTDAVAALEYIRKEGVRIIITDICMPEMDGLEITEQIRKLDKGAKVILLTGFAEFEYARKAVTLGAFEYLLKPMNPEKLMDALDRADRALGQEEILNEQHEKLQEQLDMTLPVYMERLLNQWVYGWASEQEKTEVQKVIPADSEGFVLATRMPGISEQQAALSKEEAKEMRNQIIWWMREQIARPWHSLSFFSNILPDTLITVVTRKKNRTEQISSRSKIFKCGNEADLPELELPVGTVQLEYIMGISMPQQELISNIEVCYQSAVEVLQYSFYFPDLNIVRADYILSHRSGQISISLAEEEFVREAVKEGDKGKAVDVFRSILDRCLANGYPEPEQLKNSLENMLNHVAKTLRLEEEFHYETVGQDNIEVFEAQVTEYLQITAAKAGAGKNEKNAEFASKCMEWMNQHYGEDISLDGLAEFLGLTPAYCSAMIKEAAGVTFSKCLLDIRLRRAKELLLKTDLRIYEIAEQVGYSDVKYFNRVFKKETGVIPTQYRDDLQKIIGGGMNGMRNRIKEYYGNLNLRGKLRFSYILLILIPVTFLCIIYYWGASKSILEIAKDNILVTTEKNVQIFDSVLQDMQEAAVQINVDKEVFHVLQGIETVTDSELLLRDKKINTLLQKYFSQENIISATIMTPRYVLGDNSRLTIPNSVFYESELYQDIKGKKGTPQWIPTYKIENKYDLGFEAQVKTVMSLMQELNPVWINPESPGNSVYLEPDPEAVLIINLNEGVIGDIFRNSNSVKDSFYCVSTKDGGIVAHTDAEKNGTLEELPWLTEKGGAGSVVLNYNKEKVVVCYAVSEVTGWVAASVTPVHSLLKNVSKIQMLTVVVWILLSVMAMVLSDIFSKRITRPIGQLVGAMKCMGKGDYSTRLPIHGTDEMQYLMGKYNEMGERIQVLIEENYEKEIRKKEAELMALDLQLNPHFLYNTLNIVNMMALEEGNLDVSKMLISLSDMLQYTFRNQQELVVFEEEYVWLQNYLHIMGVRFEGKFEVHYEVENSIFKYRVPKLLLQPLVENAVVHGFRGMEKGGLLEIKARQEDAQMYLEICDNGKGMNAEELERAMNRDYNRIGLSNAVRRLQLIYGEKGAFRIDSKEGEGTRIIVQFPCER